MHSPHVRKAVIPAAGLGTRLTVEADTLLQPTSSTAGQQDARLVISVTLTPYQSILGNMGI